jgi:hypothetical protein
MRNQKIRDNGSVFNRYTLPELWAQDASNDSTDFESNEFLGNGAALIDDIQDYPVDNDTFIYSERTFLNAAERRFINKYVGAIVRWDSQGFYYVTWYEDMNDLQHDWKLVSAEFDVDSDEYNESECDEMYA